MGGRLARVRGWLSVFTPAGWAVLVLGPAILFGAERTGLAELRVVGALFVVLFCCCLPWLLLPAPVRARLTIYPPRTVAGDTVVATLSATAAGRWRVWHPLVHLPAGATVGWLRLDTLAPGRRAERRLEIPTTRRGVIDVGPAVHHRSDPMGLTLRRRTWVEPVELYVRPRMVSLDSIGSAQVRDLEGSPSDQISMSDLAFHALREYVRGDDLRHVHWRSSARAGELLVRQYHDSRRTQATVLLDPADSSYASEESYELAVEIAASLAASAGRVGHDLNLLSDAERVVGLPPDRVLDALCRVERGPGTLRDDVVTMQVIAPHTSLVLVVTGGEVASDAVFASAQGLPGDVEVVVLRAVPGEQTHVGRHKAWSVRTVGRLADLPGAMAVR